METQLKLFLLCIQSSQILKKKGKKSLNFSLVSKLKIRMRLNHKIRLKKLEPKLQSKESET
jgi:hypothetical protein